MNAETVTLYLTVCDTEEASNIIGVLTEEELIISANITATSDIDHSFDQHIAEDTEVVICITVEEDKLDKAMKRIGYIHDQAAESIRINSESPRARAYRKWTSTKFFPDKY